MSVDGNCCKHGPAARAATATTTSPLAPARRAPAVKRMRAAAPLLLLVLASAAASTGCTAALEQRVARLETANEERGRQLDRAMQQAAAQVRTLNEQLEQARTQTRNLANLGARLDGIEEQLRTVSGSLGEVRNAQDSSTTEQNALRIALAAQITALEQRVVGLERRTGILPAVDATTIPSDNPTVIRQANAALASRDFNRARALANALLQRAPQDPLADDARLILGRSYLQENRAATAVQEFQRLLTDFPTADTVPDALTDMSEAFVRLGLCVPAQRTLRILIDRHGSTPQGQAARRRLDEVRHLPRAACTG